MRLAHFQALAPLCPQCRRAHGREVPLVLGPVLRRAGDVVVEGVLHCSDRACFLEYPIIDGVPIILPETRGYIAANLAAITEREDLPPLIESLLGDAAGPGTPHDVARQHLSTYAWDGYGELDPEEEPAGEGRPAPGAVARCLEAALSLVAGRPAPPGPALDLGCAVGRSSFALAAARPGLVLGIDLSFAMLRLAQRVLLRGEVSYPRRRQGVVYDRRRFTAAFAGAERVDFWACDALALPFAGGRIALAAALNLLDCVPSPRDLLAALAALLAPGGHTLLATPYDWSPVATRFEAWIGGHSQRGEGGGAGEPFLRTLLTPGAHPQAVESLAIRGEIAAFPWHTRLHERSSVAYRVHVMALEKVGDSK